MRFDIQRKGTQMQKNDTMFCKLILMVFGIGSLFKWGLRLRWAMADGF